MCEDLGADVLLPGGGGGGQEPRKQGTAQHEHCTSHKSSSLEEHSRRTALRCTGERRARQPAVDWRAGAAGAAPALAAPCGLACVGLRSADLARDAALLAPAHPHYRRCRPCNVIIALKKRLHILMNADTKPAIKPNRVSPAAMRLCL